ncbi:peptidylprolyl isomerase [Salidesulfovibrio onnuriiensis]|uniref:peptidylprolyl isomerase n=1 Tax=Salidesulfovibrio onnuriiensis TaxID=2583823 RepID=UPI0011CABA3E|nr:peptidylprolyl isomerase [Salidesulfovibrio onnuriiensis]
MKYVYSFCASLLVAVACLAAPLLDAPARAGADPVVVLETSMGQIVVMLDQKNAPESVKNFLKYVDTGFYRGTVFHRVIDNRDMGIVQGGGYMYPLERKRTFAPIKNEADNGLKNKRGTIAMARTNDIDSATSQFFFNVRDNTPFDHTGNDGQTFGYAVFGKVIRGLDVVDKICHVPTERSGMMQDVPSKPIFIKKAYRK